MPIESATYLQDLNEENPLGTDYGYTADDHLRLLKEVLKNTFPHAAQAENVVHFDTVAEMKAASVADGAVVMTAGYYAAGDGGGAAYVVKTSGAFGGTPDGYGDHALANGNVAEMVVVGDVFNVRQFGAKANGQDASPTDDGPAFNAALARVRALIDPSIAITPAVVVVPAGVYYISTSINGTGIRYQAWEIIAHGAVLLGNTTGKAVVDLLDSRFCKVRGLTVVGDATNTPRIGIQIGKVDATKVASQFGFHEVSTRGEFALCGFYNYGSEVCSYYSCKFWNKINDPAAYCMILEGVNTYTLQSDYANITVSTNTATSFNEQVFVQLDARRETTGCAISLLRTSRCRFVTSYAVSYDDAAIVLVCDTYGHSYLHLDVHCETTGILRSVKLVDMAGETYAQLRGLEVIDHSPHAADSLLFATGSLTTVEIFNFNVHIGSVKGTMTQGWLHPKTAFYVYGGNVYLQAHDRHTDVRGSYQLITDDWEDAAGFGRGTQTLVDKAHSELTYKGRVRFLGVSNATYTGTDLAAAHGVTIENGSVRTDQYLHAHWFLEVDHAGAAPPTNTNTARLFYWAATNKLKYINEDGQIRVVGPAPQTDVREMQSAGVAGGTPTVGVWITRGLNTTTTDEIGVSLSSGNVYLPAGTYEVQGRVPGFRVGVHRARIYDVADSVELLLGESAYTPSTAGYAQSYAEVRGRITLSTSRYIALQHRVESDAGGTQGYGVPSNFTGVSEIYSSLVLKKID